MKPDLHVVTPGEGPAPETVGERMRRLQSETKALARQQVEALLLAMGKTAEMAAEVAACDVQPPGVRDLARRFVEDCDAKASSVDVLMGRQT